MTGAHLCKIGATSFVKVTCPLGDCPDARLGITNRAVTTDHALECLQLIARLPYCYPEPRSGHAERALRMVVSKKGTIGSSLAIA